LDASKVISADLKEVVAKFFTRPDFEQVFLVLSPYRSTADNKVSFQVSSIKNVVFRLYSWGKSIG